MASGNKNKERQQSLAQLAIALIDTERAFRTTTIIDTIAGSMSVVPRTERGEYGPQGHGLHYVTRRSHGGGGKRHGSGINQRTYSSACGGNSSPK